MDTTDGRHAYLCLPLSAANVSGWELLCPASFTAIWDGSPHPDAVEVRAESGSPWVPRSHFGYGVLTFHTGYVFRTSAGHSLWVRGPTNEFKDGLAPLEGVIETDWLPFGFTMNYMFTRANERVRFEAGEPFCLIHPMPQDYLIRIEPVIRRVESNTELEQQHSAWADARCEWDAQVLIEGSVAARQRWRKDYLRGRTPSGSDAATHARAVRLKPFEDRRDIG